MQVQTSHLTLNIGYMRIFKDLSNDFNMDMKGNKMLTNN